MEPEELRVYQLSMKLGKEVSQIVNAWDFFNKDTIGKQLVRSADSVAANISEGFGRYHYKDCRLFHYYARGSLYETKTWLTKAHERNLISAEIFERNMKEIKNIGIRLNNYINSLEKVKNYVRRSRTELRER